MLFKKRSLTKPILILKTEKFRLDCLFEYLREEMYVYEESFFFLFQAFGQL